MRALIAGLAALSLFASQAFAQSGVTPFGGSFAPPGANGQTAYNNNGAWGAYSLTGDCSYPVTVGTSVCTGLSGLSLPAGNLFGNSTASPAAPASTTLTALIDQALGSTRGSILERGASGWAILAPGSSTTVLTSNGPAADPTYQAVAGGTGCTLSGGAANNVVTTNVSNTCTPVLVTMTSAGVTTFPAAGAASASSVNFTGTVFTGGSGTTTFPDVYINQGSGPTTFNTGGTEFGINAPSGFTGLFIDFHLNGGASLFSVSSVGGLSSSGSITSGAGVAAAAASTISWSGRGILTTSAAGNIQLGNTDAASPVAQTLSAQSVITGTSNTAGADAIVQGSRGTGTGVGGAIIVKTAPAGTTGTAQNAATQAGKFDTTQYFIPGGTAQPTCGTGCASIAAGATDQRMLVTTSTAVTSIAVNFSGTKTTAPICTASEIAGTPLAIGFNAAPSTSSFTLTAASALTATVIAVTCL